MHRTATAMPRQELCGWRSGGAAVVSGSEAASRRCTAAAAAAVAVSGGSSGARAVYEATALLRLASGERSAGLLPRRGRYVVAGDSVRGWIGCLGDGGTWVFEGRQRSTIMAQYYCT